MKRMTMSLALTALLAAALGGTALAQSDTSSDTISLMVTFEQPVLAGYSATVTTAEGTTATIEDDNTLRIEVPSGVDPSTQIDIALASATATDVAKVSANDATYDDLVAALEAAGVSAADRWADEIMEYRPYDTSDPTLAKLQDELAKYDPSAETVAGILSVLEP
jgi:hypothetical protein